MVLLPRAYDSLRLRWFEGWLTVASFVACGNPRLSKHVDLRSVCQSAKTLDAFQGMVNELHYRVTVHLCDFYDGLPCAVALELTHSVPLLWFGHRTTSPDRAARMRRLLSLRWRLSPLSQQPVSSRTLRLRRRPRPRPRPQWRPQQPPSIRGTTAARWSRPRRSGTSRTELDRDSDSLVRLRSGSALCRCPARKDERSRTLGSIKRAGDAFRRRPDYGASVPVLSHEIMNVPKFENLCIGSFGSEFSPAATRSPCAHTSHRERERDGEMDTHTCTHTETHRHTHTHGIGPPTQSKRNTGRCVVREYGGVRTCWVTVRSGSSERNRFQRRRKFSARSRMVTS